MAFSGFQLEESIVIKRAFCIQYVHGAETTVLPATPGVNLQPRFMQSQRDYLHPMRIVCFAAVYDAATCMVRTGLRKARKEAENGLSMTTLADDSIHYTLRSALSIFCGRVNVCAILPMINWITRSHTSDVRHETSTSQPPICFLS